MASLGLRIRNHATYHGLSLNVDMDLTPFSWINPCGYSGLRVTQLREQGVALDVDAVAERLLPHLRHHLTATPPGDNMKIDNTQGVKLKGEAKTAASRSRWCSCDERLKKPEWIRVKSPSGARFTEIKDILREQKLHTVCEEASCPNIGECFSSGTATFMIMGDICTRRCPFCDVGHGRPEPAGRRTSRATWPKTMAAMRLNYVVITSVDRDDLRDGGAQHFADCIRGSPRAPAPDHASRCWCPDFRGRHGASRWTSSARPRRTS